MGSVKPGRRRDKGSAPKSFLDQAVEKRLQGLEADRQRWRFEARKALNALHQLTRLPYTRPTLSRLDPHRSAEPHYHVLCDAPCINDRDLHGLGPHKRSVTPPARHVTHVDARRRSASMDLASVQAEVSFLPVHVIVFLFLQGLHASVNFVFHFTVDTTNE